jgi:hypothetical protein
LRKEALTTAEYKSGAWQPAKAETNTAAAAIVTATGTIRYVCGRLVAAISTGRIL